MVDSYQPPSKFLRKMITGGGLVNNTESGKESLAKLIELMKDPNRANRDWATLLLAQQEVDGPTVRVALTSAANDQDEHVRAEAILGIAQRDKSEALALIRRELLGNHVSAPLLEAAEIVAHPSFIDDLRGFTAPSGDVHLDSLTIRALTACERNQSKELHR